MEIFVIRIINMSVFLVVFFSMASKFVAQSDSVPGISCMFQGADGNGTFELSYLPERCEAVIYGGNYFNKEPPAADTDAITQLTAAGKTVHMLYMYDMSVNWTSIMTSPDTSVLANHIAPMIKYFNDHKISGVHLMDIALFNEEINNYACNVNTLISLIKKGVPGIKVAIWIYALYINELSDVDFTVINSLVDMYVIDTTTYSGLSCHKDLLSKGGNYPITSTDPKIITLEKIKTATQSSAMDQNKLLINLADIASKGEDPDTTMVSYSEYCSRTDNGVWCVDTIEILYNEVIYLKDLFKGIVISYMDTDDTTNSCGCGIAPIANTYIDAWQGKPMTSCDVIGAT